MKINKQIIQHAGHAPVPVTFFEQEAPDCRHLALLFPGLYYTNAHPALHYTRLALQAAGADVCAVDTDYTAPTFQALPDSEQYRRIVGDAEATWRAAGARRLYTRHTLVGKSLGTLVLGHLLVSQPGLRGADYVWLTPLLRHPGLYAQLTSTPHRGLFVIGSADPHYDPRRLAEVERLTGGRSLVLDGAHHGLEIDGDVPGSVRLMEQLVRSVAGFVSQG